MHPLPDAVNGTAASTQAHRLLDDGTPTTTRIAAERGLQAAEQAWRTSHSSQGQLGQARGQLYELSSAIFANLAFG